MLKSYQETKETIARHEETIKTEKAEIEALRAESAEQQGQVEELVQITYNQINTYAADLQDAESEEAVLLNKISSQEADINAPLKQAKDEEAAAKKAAEEAAAKKAAEKQQPKRLLRFPNRKISRLTVRSFRQTRVQTSRSILIRRAGQAISRRFRKKRIRKKLNRRRKNRKVQRLLQIQGAVHREAISEALN